VSDVSDVAAVSLMIADYAVVDAAGKLNIIGGGVSTLGYVANVGLTAPFALIAAVSVPPGHYNAECSLEIILEDASGAPVALPGPSGEAQVMRIGQAVRFDEPRSQPGVIVPRHVLPSRQQWVLAFNTGLPLPLGQKYAWRVKIDTETRHEWAEPFFVPGHAAGPVLG
jgi:hypothetical protein